MLQKSENKCMDIIILMKNPVYWVPKIHIAPHLNSFKTLNKNMVIIVITLNTINRARDSSTIFKLFGIVINIKKNIDAVSINFLTTFGTTLLFFFSIGKKQKREREREKKRDSKNLM